jgi:hypothetical protein
MLTHILYAMIIVMIKTIFVIYVAQGAFDTYRVSTDSLWLTSEEAQLRVDEIKNYWNTAVELLEKDEAKTNNKNSSMRNFTGLFWEGLEVTIQEVTIGKTNELEDYLPMLFDIEKIIPDSFEKSVYADKKYADFMIERYVNSDAATQKSMREFVQLALNTDDDQPFVEPSPFS